MYFNVKEACTFDFIDQSRLLNYMLEPNALYIWAHTWSISVTFIFLGRSNDKAVVGSENYSLVVQLGDILFPR